MTINFTIGETIYPVPASWEGVTFAKYLEWVNEWVTKFPSEAEQIQGTHESSDIEYPIKLLSFQTDIPLDILKEANWDGLQAIRDSQVFWFDFETLNAIHINSVSKDIVDTVSIDAAPASYMIEFVHGLKDLGDKHFLNIAPDLIQNYFQVDIKPEPVTKYYGMATFFLRMSAVTGVKNRSKYNLHPQLLTKMLQVLKCLKVSG